MKKTISPTVKSRHCLHNLVTVGMGIFLLLLSPSMSWGNEECSILEQKNELSNKASPLHKFDLKTVATKDVVLLGEEHTFAEVKDLSMILALIKNNKTEQKNICLFLEFPKSLKLQEFKSSLTEPSMFPSQRKYRKYYSGILEAAEKHKYQVHFVDHEKQLQQNLSLNERDKAMAMNMSQLIDSEDCASGVLIVGKAHISPDEDARTLVRDHLDELGLSTATLNIQYAQDKVINSSLKSWNDLCPEKAQKLDEPRIFENKALSGLAIYPRLYRGSLFDYFDFTVLF